MTITHGILTNYSYFTGKEYSEPVTLSSITVSSITKELPVEPKSKLKPKESYNCPECFTKMYTSTRRRFICQNTTCHITWRGWRELENI